MNRMEFMEELETLLGDISEEERSEALEYYEAYFEDAGKEKETEVIRELKSPKKVAESIKAGLRGEDRAIYTERGYEEEKEQNEQQSISLEKQPVSSGKISLEKDDIGQEAENGQNYESEQQEYTYSYKNGTQEQKNYTAIIIIAVLTSPIWGSILLGLLGGILGLIGGILGVIIGIFSAAIGLLIGGIAVVLYGMVTLTGIVSLGLLEIGIGLLCISGGGILLWGGLALVTRAIPAFIKWIIKKIKKIFHKKGEHML